jgi:DNA-binding transcriptional MerR regulator
MADENEPGGLSVAEMSQRSGVSAHTLRYYERAGLIQAIARTVGKQRRYSEADVEWVKFLLRLRETGMPIAQMRQYAEHRAQGTSTVPSRLALLETHQRGLREQIALLRRHERALEAKIVTYRHELTELSTSNPPNNKEKNT